MASNPVFASIPDPFRPVRVHVEVIQIVYIPYVAFALGTTTHSYDSRDNLTGASLPGGLAASYAYDNVNRLSSWSVSKAGSNFLARSCIRNGLGFKETESITAGLEAFDGPSSQVRAHNAGDQIAGILQVGPSATNAPSFDPAGNTTQVVLTAKGQTFTTLYRYDYENRLLSVTRLRNGTQGQSVTTSVVQLEYDGLGLLLRITDTGTIRRLVRDRVDQLARPLVETDGSGNTVRWFVWANGRLLAQVEFGNVVHVAHCDELGRVLAFSDNNGALTDEYAYQPCGRLIAHSGTTATPLSWLGGFGVWDAGHGLYLTRHRAYDANLMCFTQTDPLGLDGGWNLYLYANASPLFFVDILGLCYSEGPSWGQGGTYGSSYSSYNGAVLRAPENTAARVEAVQALTLGANFRPDSAMAESFAFNNAANILSAPGQAIVLGAIGNTIGRVVNAVTRSPTPTTALSPYRYTQPGETFYHYGYAEQSANFANGMRVGSSYGTTVRGLSGAQAQSGLALPRDIPPNAVYTVTPTPGTPIRVNPITQPAFGRPGGLPEVQFYMGTQPGTVSGPIRIP